MKGFDKSRAQEPIALVGIGCRFPGGIRGPESLWDFICSGKDAITDVPEDRWNIEAFYDEDRNKPCKMYVRRAGFLEKVREFEPQFFGISPRESSYMDPQQRLLLETTWEAFEDAGISPETLTGSRTGVYLGLFMHDFENIQSGITERELIGPYSATGPSPTIAANRISYIFNLKGPSIMVDTACSSSLVAVHLACSSLLQGETDMALAAGVNLILKPEMMISLCKGSFLSPDGSCKSFDAAANGYVRSEGVGVLLLKRLSDAIASNDRIYALIRGTSVNQDGHSDGLTVPDLSAQVSLIREALDHAGMEPGEIDYMEAHGTGTPVGDPVEAEAIGTVLGNGRSSTDPCILGSIKSNIGHTESVAGVAGVIKAALAVRYGKIPGNLHFKNPNPVIPFDDLRLRVPTSLEEWPERGDKLRAAAVNSFGFGGTNAHAILQEYRAISSDKLQPISSSTAESPFRLIPLSAHSPEALRAKAKELSEYINYCGNSSLDLEDVGHTLSLRRSHHSHRICFVVSSIPELSELIDAYLSGERRSTIIQGVVGQKPLCKSAWVFSGMGQQWWGMGRVLINTQPLFRQVIKECHELFSFHTTEWSLWEQLTSVSETDSRIQDTCVAQPAIFAIQVGVAALLQSWGIKPDMVVGHSVGEVAAAYVSGALSLKDAVLLSFHRSRLQQSTAGQGGMLAVGLSQAGVTELLDCYGDRISVAAVNSPSAVTLSGEEDALAEIALDMEAKSIFARAVNVEVPYHSRIMDQILPELAKTLTKLNPQSGTIPMVSTVTGELVEGIDLDASYWLKNVREPVLFSGAVQTLVEAGCDIFLEIGSHPVLSSSLIETLSAGLGKLSSLSSLRRNELDDMRMLAIFGGLYTQGYVVDWKTFYEGAGELIQLPLYPWQRQVYWRESEVSAMSRQSSYSGFSTLRPMKSEHPLLGCRIDSVLPCWNNEIGQQLQSYLGDHRVQETIVFPAAGFIELGLASAKSMMGEVDVALSSVKIFSPLVLSQNKPTAIQVHADAENRFTIHSRLSGDASEWILHASGFFESINGNARVPELLNLDEIRQRCQNEISPQACYAALAASGLTYGTMFQGIRQIFRGKDEALGCVGLTRDLGSDIPDYWLHPVLLDACFQVAASLSTDGTYLPLKIDRLELHARPEGELWCHATIEEHCESGIQVKLRICDINGAVIVAVTNLFCQVMEGTKSSQRESIEGDVFEYEWQQQALNAAGNNGAVLDLPSPVELVRVVEPRIALLAGMYRREEYDQRVEPALERTCLLFLAEALRSIGWDPGVGDLFDSNSLGEKLGVAVAHRKLWIRLIGFLSKDGLIEPEGEFWRVVRTLPIESAEVSWRESLSNYPACSAEVLLLGRCGSNLADFLTGKADPLSFIFADGSTLAEHFYRHSPTYRIYNHLMRDMVRQMLALLPSGKKLRILEVGGGTGSLAFQILPWLPPSRATYTFTDISNSFVIQAQRRFRDYGFVEYRQLDLEKSLSEQEIKVGQFDLVLASDVLHATADLRRSLSAVKKLLVPGGMFLCLEMTRASRWLDMIFGLLPGWWLFSDYDLRPDHALMAEKRWCELLGNEGFTQVTTLSDRSNISKEPQHAILAALSPSDDAASAEHQTDLTESRHDTGEELSVEVQKRLSRPWFIYQDNRGIATRLAGKLGEYNINPLVLEDGRGFELKDMGENSGISPVVVYVCQFEDSENRDPETVLDDLTDECMAFLRPLQELMQHQWQESPLVYLVTSGSQGAAGLQPRAEQASIWNLRRVLANECPEWETVAIDLSPAPTEYEIEGLIQELLADSLEDEVALRGDSRFVHRLVRRSVNELVSSDSTAFELQARQRRSINGLAFAGTVREIPQPNEVEVNIKACGLNFKDVAKLTGLLDDTSAAETSLDKLGLEIAGVVTAVGAEVENLRIGDRVFGFAANGFRSYLTVASQALVRMPEHLSFEDAATIPVAYSTGWLALRELAGIKSGERVLIHSASGAVGMAAIKLALDVGAVVYATAGSPEKRAIVAALGAVYVGDSRAKNFAEEILEQTSGEGVDVILNTLPSSTFPTSLAALKPYSGRMIDISNVYEKNLAMAPLCKGVAFSSFDMERMLPEHPERVHSILTEISAKIDRGELGALPSRVFEAAEIRDAFQLMRSSRHIGKIVVSFEEAPVRVEFTNQQMPVRSDGAYLITGGFGGVGLATAKWLSECGARHLVLVGRNGAATEEAKKALQELRDMGVEVVEEEADISSHTAVTEIMERISDSTIPLRGVIHGAMVLDDMSLGKITATSMRNVLNPKVLGLLNLHQATRNLTLDFFICHSSFASLFGNQDQGNYVAANGFMEALMQSRREEGLPGLAMCWGVLGEFGYVANNADIKDFFRREGMMPLLPAQTWRSLVFGLGQKSAVLGVMNVNFRKLARYMESISTLPRYSFLARSAGHGDGASESENAESGQSLESLEQSVMRAVTNTLGIARDQLDLDASLESLGFDSLMAMEMVVAVEEAVGIKLAKMILMQGGLNTRGLIQIVEDERLKKGLPPAKEVEIQKASSDPQTYLAGTVSENDDISNEVARLTDEQVDQLLSSLTNEKLGEA